MCNHQQFRQKCHEILKYVTRYFRQLGQIELPNCLQMPEVYSILSPNLLSIVHCTLYIVQCTLYIVLCTLYIVHCACILMVASTLC